MKIGCVPYGHARPFAGAWRDQEPVWAHPRELAETWRRSEVDLALVPVWEVLVRPGTRVLDGLAIGCCGEVRSVGVFHDRPLSACRTIRLTPRSITSVQLWKLVAAQKKIRLAEKNDGETKLLIGDEALQEWNRRAGQGVLDLGQAWKEWTGKPFIFAVWALSPETEVSARQLQTFRQACEEGIRGRDSLAADEREKEYLTRCIQYKLGPEEKAGLEEFAARSGCGELRIAWV